VPTNLAIDDRLIEEAKKLGHFKTKKAAVTAALDEFIRRRKQLRILKLEQSLDYMPGYDHKASRRAR
jgi:Arc/MetJ family transcription regulator